ncbi:MAG TPA: SDR family oxidoreductase [Bryobacteraceae bacterium]|jgi:NAD(P)-dependent dehydrogenase (short-subunit alcohol dehydrogenase family)|nr:SDR family oxidoreductase [Bryobacteraceae bacterium]
MPELDGKVALVTGGTSGIGLAAATALAKEGAYVYITGRRERELATAVQEISGNAAGIRGDVSNADDLDRLFARIRDEKGRLDILFANAGISKYAALGNISEELFDSIFNVKGVLFTVQKALPLMPEGASIILNASVVASKGLASNSVYSATKAAIRSFARTWTTDLKGRRIRVNTISPGTIDTPGLNELLASGEAGEQRRKMVASAIPLGRFGQPDEVANAVVFLASDDSSYITGTELFVDGGLAQI